MVCAHTEGLEHTLVKCIKHSEGRCLIDLFSMGLVETLEQSEWENHAHISLAIGLITGSDSDMAASQTGTTQALPLIICCVVQPSRTTDTTQPSTDNMLFLVQRTVTFTDSVSAAHGHLHSTVNSG